MSNLVPVADIEKMALAIAKSKMFGMKTPEEAFALMLIAQAEGMHPAIAARDYHVIQGRPALKADAMLARFQTAGGSVNWKVYEDTQVTGLFTHPQGGSLEVTWTLAQAKAIGIAGKDNWKNYPRAMLRARCISEGIRSVYPGCVVGVYTPEEVEDFSPAKAKDMGKAEEVAPTLETMKADIEGDFPILMPGGEIYRSFDTVEQWTEGYVTMIAKIKDSPKFSDEQKDEKIQLFKDANKGVFSKLDIGQQAKLAAQMAKHRGETKNPKALASLPTDTEPSESKSMGIY